RGWDRWLMSGFNTPSRRIEFYSATLLDHGYPPLPGYEEPAVLGRLRELAVAGHERYTDSRGCRAQRLERHTARREDRAIGCIERARGRRSRHTTALRPRAVSTTIATAPSWMIPQPRPVRPPITPSLTCPRI